MNSSYITRLMKAGDLTIPQVSTELKIWDFLGAVMVRWGINRNRYMVEPGLYAAGKPDADSDVFVTANYKLSFDHLRKNLSGIDGWILVLDTRGVNVWCAAGKGTFGTDELVKRMRLVSLDRLVNHRRLIVPQLGATGVAAHRVNEETGFKVTYGPVRASDIKKFIDNRYHTDRDMRMVRFALADRVKLISNDLMYWKYYLLASVLLLFLLSGVSATGISYRDMSGKGLTAVITVFMAYIAGTVITPILLPYLPGRYFSLKGIFSGILVYIGYLIVAASGQNIAEVISWFFVIGAISSYTAMNFTGSSTYTSLSGVKKEMKLFVPLQITFAVVGIILQVTGKLI